MRRLLLAFLCLTLASSCSSAPFQPGKPVDCGGFFLSCEQSGVEVDQGQVRDALRAKPETESDERASEAWRAAAFVAALAGASLMAYKFMEGTARILANSFGTPVTEPYDNTLFWVGVGTYTVGLGMGAVSRAYFGSAVGRYNADLKTTSAVRLELAFSF